MSASAPPSRRAARIAAVLAVLALAGASRAAAAGPVHPRAQRGCGRVGELGFVCGAANPEDLARIPGTPWLIVTGFTPGGGLKLVDTRKKALRRWFDGRPSQVRPDRTRFPRCPGPPDAKRLDTQGLHLQWEGDGRGRLYVVNHGGREAIEVFDVEAHGRAPSLAWIGCLPMPAGYAANSVSAYSDGTVLATVLTRPGTTITDFVEGRITGGVYQWAPGDGGFRLLPGTELPGNNGLETSRDGRRFYVVAFGWHAVVVYDRADTSKPVARIEAPDFMPDNVHWDGDRLIAAGMRLDEPACGGRRKVVNGVADMMTCHRGYVVAELDPDAGLFRTIAYAEPNAAFNAVSGAVVIGDELWLGAFRSDRIAWRDLPGQVNRPRLGR